MPAVMERQLVRTERMITPDQARHLLETNPVWLVIERSSEEKPVLALKAVELARWLLEHDESLQGKEPPEDELIDLLEIPGQRLELAPIGLQATLSEAFLKLQDNALGRSTWYTVIALNSGVFQVLSLVALLSDITTTLILVVLILMAPIHMTLMHERRIHQFKERQCTYG
ncbi:hypothetical protein HSBAA_66800 [Vreelandella sulfidaeris]|uniref:Uncharacterized protein n=1 Tax=Vreelandella sulfidaeris TaxID=115553 RepID=A0A455UR30_9GAMM|nr:hypothetical protein HSBAA_66800 [Halomonas sulfidaeris]